MSSIDDTQAAIDALENPEVEEQEPITGQLAESMARDTQDDGSPDESVATSEAILGKFKTQDDLVKAYQELERQFTQERQTAEPAIEEPAPYNPLENFALGYDDADRQQIADSTMRVPEETLKWAMSEEIARFNPNLQNEVYALWQSFAPLDAQKFAANLAVQGERQQIEQLRNEWHQEQQQKAAANNERSATNALSLTTQKLGDFETYRPRIAELMNDFMLPDNHPLAQTPEGLAQFTEHLYWIAKGEEFKRQEAAATQAPAAKATGQKARTQTRSTAASESELPADIAEFMEGVLAGQPGRN